MSTAPPELAGGQDDKPPDLRRALLVVLLLLADLAEHLERGGDHPHAAKDLRLRIRAVSAVLQRIAEGIHDGR